MARKVRGSTSLLDLPTTVVRARSSGILRSCGRSICCRLLCLFSLFRLFKIFVLHEQRWTNHLPVSVFVLESIGAPRRELIRHSVNYLYKPFLLGVSLALIVVLIAGCVSVPLTGFRLHHHLYTD